MKGLRLGVASMLTVAGAALFAADSFLPWNRACRTGCLNFDLWHGTVGVEAGVAAIGLLAFEATNALGGTQPFGVHPARVRAVVAGLVLFFTLLKMGVDSAYLSIGAWVGLALASAIVFIAYWSLHVAAPTPATDGGSDPLDGPRPVAT